MVRDSAGSLGSRRKAKRDRARPATRGDEALPRHLQLDELARLRKAIARGGSVRDDAMFGLMYRFGLRAVEVTKLQLQDLDLERQRLRIRRAKGGGIKEYALPADLVPALRRYLQRGRADKGRFLFTGRQSTNEHGLRVLQVTALFKRYAEEAGLPPDVASHSLRHSIAVHSLDAGYGLHQVADLLGHKSVRSTEIYAKVSSQARDAMVRDLATHPAVLSWKR